MKRVTHPTCCGCGKVNPEYISERWQVRVCYQCLYQFATWLMNRDLADHNPLAEELLDGVFSGGPTPRDDEYTVIHQSRYAANASAFSLVKRPSR